MKGSEKRREYWDSCLFIAFLQADPEEKKLVDAISTLLGDAQAGKTTIVVSTFVLAEVRPYEEKYDDHRLAAIMDVFGTNRDYIEVVAVTRSIAMRASNLAVDHRKLTNPDAIHIATALHRRVDVFLTTDGRRRDGGLKRGKLLDFDGKLGDPPLTIKLPRVDVGPLFENID